MSQYHLRKITEKGMESNYALGDQYTVINRKKHKDEFTKIVEAHYKEGIDEAVFAFIYNGFGQVFNLFKNERVYIVTNSGATFSNLTFKEKQK